MRNIKYIAIHCTATPQNTTIDSIKKYWREHLKWKSVGYHHIVKPDGVIDNLLPIESVSNGVAGFNSVTINISYIGGVDVNNKPIDNRTAQQKESLLSLVKKYKQMFPTAIVQGHKDFPNVKKACPSFNAKKEYELI